MRTATFGAALAVAFLAVMQPATALAPLGQMIHGTQKTSTLAETGDWTGMFADKAKKWWAGLTDAEQDAILGDLDENSDAGKATITTAWFNR